jgi:plasmid stabilization system protein ParE
VVRLTWHLEAEGDLEAIAGFISRQSPLFAGLFVERIVAAAEHLERHPSMARIVPELRHHQYREVIFQNYRIVYRIIDNNIVIVGVIHAAMDLSRQGKNRGWDVT